MKKLPVKSFVFLLMLISFLLLTFGCSKRSVSMAAYSGGGAAANRYEKQAAYDMAMEDTDRPYNEAAEPETSAADTAGRKLAKTANFTIRVENLEESDASVTGLMEKYGAYSASTVISEDSRYYSIRVPSTAYDEFIAGAGALGRILQRQESAEDVTLRYYDLEGRLATKRELLKTYQAYLGQARNIEEILSVEAKIAELQNDLEGTGRELRNLANRVDYASVDLSIRGPVASTPYRGPTAGERFRELFSGFSGFLSVLAVVLAGIVVYGIPVLLLLVLLFWLLFGKVGLLKKLLRAAAGKGK
jgi:hypothetical protein